MGWPWRFMLDAYVSDLNLHARQRKWVSYTHLKLGFQLSIFFWDSGLLLSAILNSSSAWFSFESIPSKLHAPWLVLYNFTMQSRHVNDYPFFDWWGIILQLMCHNIQMWSVALASMRPGNGFMCSLVTFPRFHFQKQNQSRRMADNYHNLTERGPGFSSITSFSSFFLLQSFIQSDDTGTLTSFRC